MVLLWDGLYLQSSFFEVGEMKTWKYVTHHQYLNRRPNAVHEYLEREAEPASVDCDCLCDAHDDVQQQLAPAFDAGRCWGTQPYSLKELQLDQICESTLFVCEQTHLAALVAASFAGAIRWKVIRAVFSAPGEPEELAHPRSRVRKTSL